MLSNMAPLDTRQKVAPLEADRHELVARTARLWFRGLRVDEHTSGRPAGEPAAPVRLDWTGGRAVVLPPSPPSGGDTLVHGMALARVVRPDDDVPIGPGTRVACTSASYLRRRAATAPRPALRLPDQWGAPVALVPAGPVLDAERLVLPPGLDLAVLDLGGQQKTAYALLAERHARSEIVAYFRDQPGQGANPVEVLHSHVDGAVVGAPLVLFALPAGRDPATRFWSPPPPRPAPVAPPAPPPAAPGAAP